MAFSQRARAYTLNPTLPCPTLPLSPRALSDSSIIPAAGRLCLKLWCLCRTQFRRARRQPTPVQAQGGGGARAVLPRGQKRAKCLEVSFGLEGNVSPGTRFILHNYGLEVQTGKRLQPQIGLLGKIGNHSQPQTHTCNSFNNGATTRL